ncbi:uncharacterized protein EHS24_001438 [Apiotrichum porosum]|uniref:Uncharacterized protein n=1 Tax=Apiotrichum porosum TaxID=105984 RepID=A0A427XKS8_9TREE|nr:uncharacterized protein EHS24_001438 [Apiotrichum porosum]RSH79392.1 hypothetical protein EHS24_001438 [Apiotrichum porosum]
MPKAPSTRSRSGPVAASTPSLPPNPPPSRSRPHAAAPSWLRTDWSNTAFAIPVFSGSFNSGAQIKWAAKNATVVLHDAFGAGHWDDIIDKPYAVYLAVCDLVLQLKDDAVLKDNGENKLPDYQQWNADRERDIEMVFGWARRDLTRYAGPLHLHAAQQVCRSALQALFCEGDDAETGPVDGEHERVPVDLDAMREFEPRPADLDRYNLVVHHMSVGDEHDEGAINDEITAWQAKHGSFVEVLGADKGLSGLPTFPKNHRPNIQASSSSSSSYKVWTSADFPERPQDLRDIPTLESLL